MRLTGNLRYTLLTAILVLATNYASGAVQATLDRDRVALGDTLQLTLNLDAP